MALVPTKKAAYKFEMNPTVTVSPFQTIRGEKDGVEVSLTVPVTSLDGGKVAAAAPSVDDIDEFKANIEKGKTYKIQGTEMTVTRAGRKKVTLESKDETITLTPDELFNQSE